MAKNKVITPDMVDWNAYKRSLEESITNETIWAMGGSEFAEDNIANMRYELELIDNGEYEEVFAMYDNNVWVDYLKN